MRKRQTLNRMETRGFTLTELAIFLGAMGLVFAAIWVAIGNVSSNNHVSKTIQQVLQISQNIREYYMNQQGIPAACNNNEITTTIIDANGLFPTDMRRCSGASCNIDSAFIEGGAGANSFEVRGSATAGTCVGTTATRFRIVLTNLTPAACVQLLFSGINYQDSSLGIAQICPAQANPTCDNAVGWQAITCSNGICGIPSGATYAPITLAQAQTFCGNGATAEVGWEFNLHH
jgi:type II secretory pathway pseudopilin PulG